MSDLLTFATREDFRQWLRANCQSSPGVWLLFGKTGGPTSMPRPTPDGRSALPGWWTGSIRI